MHFSRYVNLFRVDAATELLQHTDLPITEIALQSGFQSIRNFNRVFLEITGKTPSRQFK
jgi:transcriptional regulator GlxA family with amidase domain